MTEAEWLNCIDPEIMLEFLRGKAGERKLRLFAVACCRRIWHLLIDERSKKAVVVVERDADQGQPEEIAMAFHGSECAFRECEFTTERHADAAGAAFRLVEPSEDVVEKAIRVFLGTANASGYLEDASYLAHREDVEAEYLQQCDLLRDIFNPFRPTTIALALLTADVLELAQYIYEERAFDRLPILADALEESGCHEADILDHCRGPGPHTRGCWVIDLVLGKS